ncbi:MAG: phosphoribosylglycinamide formyltransferase [Candidatus Omnitrophica bacterium]|nr:phosphoribosylglycinamide formyltransferase [Candidatus Omnitrophota bacterium]HOX54790.1 phosphoribosylglycinamide formyltransferase [Candidatus Omnitrophota bacterium]
MNFAVFASGNGTNLQAIIKALKKGKINANLALVLSDNKEAYALKRAKRAKIKTVVVEAKNFSSREDYDAEIVKILEQEKIDFIVLAGFMRIITSVLINNFRNKILNIHPALLPSFKGTHAIVDAFNYGVKVTGVTVHFVDEKMDHGPIILQGSVKVEEDDTAETLEAKIHKIEHKIYPEAIRLFSEGKIKIEGRKARIA